MGTVLRFLFTGPCPPRNAKPPYAALPPRPIPIVLVKMDAALSHSCLSDIPNVVPISAETSSIGEGTNRIQLPLFPAHASTIHSVQGLTAEHGIVLTPSTSYNAQGLMYVACSRPRKMEDILLLAPLTTKHFTYGIPTFAKIDAEYKRLEEQYLS